MPTIGIVGSREFCDAELMYATVVELAGKFPNFTLVSGGAKGADTLAVQAYHRLNDAFDCFSNAPVEYRLDAPEAFAAFGNDFRARAFGRNGWIVRDADIIVAFFVTPNESGGTLNTCNQARRAGVPVMAHHPVGWRAA